MKKNLIEDFNLPKYLKGKSFAEASKAINKKFDGREDMHAEETKKELLDRLAKAQEYVKMQESLKANSQEVPDMMNGQIPSEVNQHFLGGMVFDEGTKAQSSIDGAIQGASTGMGLAGPWGAAVGGVLGLGAGLIGGGKQEEKQQITPAGATNDFEGGGDIGMAGAVFNSTKDFLDGKVGKGKGFFGKAGDWIGDNYGNILRSAPIASNAIQLKNLEKPDPVSLNRMDARYKTTPVDERTLENRVQNEANNTTRALANASNGSIGALRSNLLGSQLQKTNALSNAYMQADQVNRQENQAAQQFNQRTDMMNLRQDTVEQQMNDQNEGAYNSMKSALQSQLATDIGNFGKEKVNMKQVAEMFGYGWDGKYFVDKAGKKIDPKTILNKEDKNED